MTIIILMQLCYKIGLDPHIENSRKHILPSTRKSQLRRKIPEEKGKRIKKSGKQKPSFILILHLLKKKSPEEVKKYFEQPEKATSTMLSKATLKTQKNKADEFLLPITDIKYDVSQFRNLFNKPNWTPPHRNKRRKLNEENKENEEHHFDLDTPIDDVHNEFDALLNIDLNAPAPTDVPALPGGTGPSSDPLGLGGPLKLIDAPPQMEKISVNYARVAKSVDVKALKHALWKAISQTKKNKNTERNFQSVLDVMPEHIPQDMLASVTVPYYFICLLHLANENNLTLKEEGQGLFVVMPEK